MRAPIGLLKPTAVTEAFQAAARKSGLSIPYQGPHCLRHAYALHLLKNGTPLKTIGDILGVLYKTGDTPLLIALALLLAVVSSGLGMVLPVVLLIVGMGLAPLSAAVADHLGVLGVGLALTAPVVAAPPRLAFRPAAHRLIGTARGG